MSNPTQPDQSVADEAVRLELTDIILKVTGKTYLTKSSRQGVEDMLQWHNRQLKALLLDARITALTDVDNLNLLNNNDVWHEFYMDELAKIATQKNQVKDNSK